MASLAYMPLYDRCIHRHGMSRGAKACYLVGWQLAWIRIFKSLFSLG